MTVLKVRYSMVDRNTHSPVPFKLQSDRGSGMVSVEHGGRKHAPRPDLPNYDVMKSFDYTRRPLARGSVSFQAQPSRPLLRRHNSTPSPGRASASRTPQSRGPSAHGVTAGLDMIRPRQGKGHVCFDLQRPREQGPCRRRVRAA
eukprot:Hpha_TRINITY_DN532_c0_g1::TRINITY_DN532_c0_g1_i1::g.171750::m.171750